MLNMYKCTRYVYINDKYIGGLCAYEGKKISENPPENITYDINWDTLDTGPYSKMIVVDCPYKVLRLFGKRKVIAVDYSTGSIFCPHKYKFKEGRDKLNIKIKMVWKQYIPSMDELFKWHNGDQVIQYLKDRGLSVCPVVK